MENYRYDAFISYRHTPRDTEVAAEIQQQLERFVIPESIRKQYGIEKITRIFKDTEELELTSDLSQQLDENLRDSRFLIVVCSNEYLQSKWCLHEVEAFLQTHSHDDVICVLSNGEPPEVFPDLLKKEIRTVIDTKGREVKTEVSIEPLACDYRGDFREARKVELPRIAARIIGSTYDELVRRQESYRRRRNRIILSTVAAAAAIIIGYLIWSNGQISKNYRAALINESRILANSSLQDLSQKDRKSALEKALEALPVSAEDSRPVTEEAIYALSRASYAYSLPFHYQEMQRIDEPENISSYFVSRDGKYIVCCDIAGNVITYSLEENRKIQEFQMYPGKTPASIEECHDGQLTGYVNGEVMCFDYLKGELLWELPLKYQQQGLSRLSHDGKLIGGADSFAMQIMTAEGEIYLSMPLPKGMKGYITDFIWSDDDSLIAVVIKNGSNYNVGVYDVNTSEYVTASQDYLRIDSFCFDENNVLYVLADRIENASVAFEDYQYQYVSQYVLSAWSSGKTRFEKTIESNTASEKTILIPLKNSVLVGIGNTLREISAAGKEIHSCQFDSDLISVTDYGNNLAEVVLSSGYKATANMDTGEINSERSFPENADEAVKDMKAAIYIVKKRGNLLLYETVFDENIRMLEGTVLQDSADCTMHNENYMAVLADRRLIIWDIGNNTRLAEKELDHADSYGMIKIIDNNLYMLHAQAGTEALYVITCDLTTGETVREAPLGISNYYLYHGFFNTPLSHSQSEFIRLRYQGASSMAVGKTAIYIHGVENPNKIVKHDLITGENQVLEFSGKEKLLDNTVMHEPAPLLVNEEENMLFTFIWDEETETSAAILLNLEQPAARILSEEITDEYLIAWKENRLVVTEGSSIQIYDVSGVKVNNIPFSEDSVLSFDYHDNCVLCVYPDNTLVIYRDGIKTRKIQLPFSNLKYMTRATFRYQYDKDRLYLYCGNSMAVINLDSESSLPVYAVDEGALDYLENGRKIITYIATGRPLMPFCLAEFEEYENEALIERGRNQLHQFK